MSRDMLLEISRRDEFSGLKGIEPESTSLDGALATQNSGERYERAAAKGCEPAEKWLAIDRRRDLQRRLDALEAAIAVVIAKKEHYRTEVDALRDVAERLAARVRDAGPELADADRQALLEEGQAVLAETLACQAKYEAELVALTDANTRELREINEAIRDASPR